MKARHLMIISVAFALLAAVSVAHFVLPVLFAMCAGGFGFAAFLRQRGEHKAIRESVTLEKLSDYRELLACQTVMDNSPEWWALANGDNKILRTSRNNARLVGRSLEGKDLTEVTGLHGLVLADGEPQTCDLHLQRRDGTTLHMNGEAMKIDSAEDHYLYVRAAPMHNTVAR